MPSIEDWINNPLGISQTLFDKNAEKHLENVKEYFMKRLSGKDAMSWVPSLNDTPLHNLQTNTLVRFRCMVQDMYDPEFYLGAYQVRDKNSEKLSMKSGKYKDIAQCRPHEEILMDSSDNVTMDRQTLYCVPVPGENTWVKEAFSCKSNCKGSAPSTSASTSRVKRTLDDETEAGGIAKPNTESSGDVNMEAAEANDGDSAENKKNKTNPGSANSTNSTPDLNFPLSGEKGPACLVKIYESENVESFKVNEVVEFVGVLSNDPAMVSFPGEDRGEQSSLLDPTEGMEGIEEESVHSPPPSLVPRLHVILANRLKHINPDLPTDIIAEENKTGMENILSEGPQLREQLVSLLQQALCGDKLAAEFTICHLVSSVYTRHDMVPLGKFSLNITGWPRSSGMSDLFYRLLQELVTTSYKLDLTIGNMNDMKFIPKKDYTANRLTSGVLQLSDHTHLLLDETAMQPGQLDANGVRNLTALGNVIRWQKVDYDFSYHTQEFHTNIPVLVMSEGKSLLTCDCQVSLNATISTGSIEEQYHGIEMYLTPDLKSKLRAFISLIRLIEYQIPEDLQKSIEDDFVEMRRENSQNMSVENFHSLLVLARLLCVSHGKTTLTRAVWEKAKSLETERKIRLSGTSGGAA